jgi:ankyrin repeat protein
MTRKRRWEIVAGTSAFLVLVLCVGLVVYRTALQRRLTEELRQAIRRTDVNRVRLLVRLGADVNTYDDPLENGARETALGIAVFYGDVELVRELLARGIRVDGGDSKGVTELQGAAGKGNVTIVEALLKAGANPDHQDSGGTGSTPLMAAAYYGRTEAVGVLLRYGARADLKDEHGETALDVARHAGHGEIVRLLGGVSEEQRAPTRGAPTGAPSGAIRQRAE